MDVEVHGCGSTCCGSAELASLVANVDGLRVDMLMLSRVHPSVVFPSFVLFLFSLIFYLAESCPVSFLHTLADSGAGGGHLGLEQ